jgi:hypothetical protein
MKIDLNKFFRFEAISLEYKSESEFPTREEYYKYAYEGKTSLYDMTYNLMKEDGAKLDIPVLHKEQINQILLLPPELYLAFKNLSKRPIYPYQKDQSKLPNYLLCDAVGKLRQRGIVNNTFPPANISEILDTFAIPVLTEMCKANGIKPAKGKDALRTALIEANIPIPSLIDVNSYFQVDPKFRAAWAEAYHQLILQMEENIPTLQQDVETQLIYPMVEHYYEAGIYRDLQKCIKYCQLDFEIYLPKYMNAHPDIRDKDGIFVIPLKTVDIWHDALLDLDKKQEAADLITKAAQIGYNLRINKKGRAQ